MASAADLPFEGKTVKTLVSLTLKRAYDVFAGSDPLNVPVDEASQRAAVTCKYRDDYEATKDLPVSAEAAIQRPQPSSGKKAEPVLPGAAQPKGGLGLETLPAPSSKSSLALVVSDVANQRPSPSQEAENAKKALQALKPNRAVVTTALGGTKDYVPSAAIAKRLSSRWPRPEWHAPWKCYRVISGHLGWVRSIAHDVGNEWFVTGSADRTIKLWDTATGTLKLTLTGHIEQVTGLAVSSRHPYMFSCGLDKKVMCWDLETNKVIRHYHGHLSGVYALALHPELDILMTGGRDSACRVWDMRTKVQIHCLSGHQSTVASILTHGADPQCITGSHDNNIRLWDIRSGKTMSTLTYHKHSVRAMAMHPSEWSFLGASADNIKKYKLPDGEFLHNMLQQQHAIINAACINQDGVIATGADNGSIWFWDWRSGNCFQQAQTIVQPGSLESEAGIFAMAFDQSGSRLVTCEADKTIKMWREDENATPESHPIQFRPPKNVARRF